MSAEDILLEEGLVHPSGQLTQRGIRELPIDYLAMIIQDSGNWTRNISSHADRTRRAPALPQLEQNDRDAKPLIDVDGPHIETVPNNYSGETGTQQQRLDAEAERTQQRFEQAEEEVSKKSRKGKDVAAKKAKDTKSSISHAGHDFNENKDNPVVLGNMVVWTAIAGALGFGAYKQHQAGTLNWGVAGAWAGAVGLFATGDYFLSQYLFQKYPRK